MPSRPPPHLLTWTVLLPLTRPVLSACPPRPLPPTPRPPPPPPPRPPLPRPATPTSPSISLTPPLATAPLITQRPLQMRPVSLPLTQPLLPPPLTPLPLSRLRTWTWQTRGCPCKESREAGQPWRACCSCQGAARLGGARLGRQHQRDRRQSLSLQGRRLGAWRGPLQLHRWRWQQRHRQVVWRRVPMRLQQPPRPRRQDHHKPQPRRQHPSRPLRLQQGWPQQQHPDPCRLRRWGRHQQQQGARGRPRLALPHPCGPLPLPLPLPPSWTRGQQRLRSRRCSPRPRHHGNPARPPLSMQPPQPLTPPPPPPWRQVPQAGGKVTTRSQRKGPAHECLYLPV